MKVYIIKHVYDVDGGFGDAVQVEKALFATKDKALAEQYVEKYSQPVAYAKPYHTLYHHELVIEKMKLKEPDLNKSPWDE